MQWKKGRFLKLKEANEKIAKTRIQEVLLTAAKGFNDDGCKDKELLVGSAAKKGQER